MTDAPPLPEGTLLSGKYRLDRLLGKGGMGAVYLAENVDIGRRVAIKVLLPEIASDRESLARFRTEARAAAAIGHPGIAEVIDFGTTAEGGAYLVMEYLEGETLGARLRRAGPLDVETTLWIGDELLAAVAAAHSKGVVHRDLKPDNVFLAEQPVRAVKVLDFGVSKFRAPGELALTRTGAVMGTPAYMSPEQARGAKDVGPATDLYAVGTLLYEALAGAPAFRGDSYNEILAKVLTEPHRPLRELRPELPAGLVAFVDRMMAKPVTERPADAQEARALLAQSAKDGAGGFDVGAATVRPGQLAAATAAAAPVMMPPPAKAPVAVAAPALAAPAAPVQASAPLDRNARLRRYAMIAFVVFVFWRGCASCRSCACDDGDRDRDRVERRERTERRNTREPKRGPEPVPSRPAPVDAPAPPEPGGGEGDESGETTGGDPLERIERRARELEQGAKRLEDAAERIGEQIDETARRHLEAPKRSR